MTTNSEKFSNHTIHQLELAPGIHSAIHNFENKDKNSKIAVLLHGSVENGRIFYSLNGKGLAPYLYRNGYNVFVVDIRGRGESIPKIDEKFVGGIYDYVTNDFEKIFHYISKQDFSNQPWLMVCHSWAGVNLMSYYARNHNKYPIKNMVFFAVKRRVKIDNLKKLFFILFGYLIIGSILRKFYGYFPAKKIGFGSDNEAKMWHKEIVPMIYKKKWIDIDGFDYVKSLKKIPQPNILNFVSTNDKYLGEEGDIIRFLIECNCAKDKIKNIHLSKKNGYSIDYDHNNTLKSKFSEKEIFEIITKWNT